MPYINAYAHVAQSAFESAIDALNPLAWYRFREDDFATAIMDSSGNNYDLTKQIATAARSAVPTRTTHPGGAYFPSVESADWGTQGTFYKRSAESLMSGATAYTMLISARFLDPRFYDGTVADQKVFGVGTENDDDAIDDIVHFRATAQGDAGVRHMDTVPAEKDVNTDVTGLIHDGVNRLYIARFTQATNYTLTTSRPGYEALLEETVAGAAVANPVDTQNFALLLNARNNTSVVADLETPGIVIDQIAIWASDIGATAEADLHSKWCDEVAGAGYYPSMMQFNGSTGFYSDTYTSSGNKVTSVIRFKGAAFTGAGIKTLSRAYSSGNRNRLALSVRASDHADADQANRVVFGVQNSAGTVICFLLSPVGYMDDEEHVLFASFDGDAGTAVFRIDGVNADDTGNADRVAPTTGTLDSGASSVFEVGGLTGAVNMWAGSLGFVGHREAYLTNYTDFMNGNLPKAIDEKNWTEWGAQPLFWSHTGEMTNNKGSAGDMTKNGTITMTTGGSP